MSCACCETAVVKNAGVALFATAMCIVWGTRGLFVGGPKTTGTSSRTWWRVLKLVLKSVLVIFVSALVLVSLILVACHGSRRVRERFFAALVSRHALAPSLDEYRCETLGLSNATGTVVEFGPGPGSNFRCLGQVSDWVGVEPNEKFRKAQDKEALARNVTFRRRTVWLKGETVDLDETFDNAILTHVLCSVEDPRAVLLTALGSLRTGGTLFVMEHVRAHDERESYYQDLFAPFFYVLGNGCQFRDTRTILEEMNDSFSFNMLKTQHIPTMPLPLRPHLFARATKI